MIEMLNGFSESYLLTVEYIDEHTEDVTNTVQLNKNVHTIKMFFDDIDMIKPVMGALEDDLF